MCMAGLDDAEAKILTRLCRLLTRPFDRFVALASDDAKVARGATRTLVGLLPCPP
jgi:hypothetical protein